MNVQFHLPHFTLDDVQEHMRSREKFPACKNTDKVRNLWVNWWKVAVLVTSPCASVSVYITWRVSVCLPNTLRAPQYVLDVVLSCAHWDAWWKYISCIHTCTKENKKSRNNETDPSSRHNCTSSHAWYAKMSRYLHCICFPNSIYSVMQSQGFHSTNRLISK